MRVPTLACAAIVIGLTASSVPAVGQTSAQTGGQPSAATAGSQELYHVHFVKAAPGKLREMVDAYANAPADPNASAPPLVLRHVEGDDWDLLVLTPMGKEAKLTVAPVSTAEQQFIQRTRPLRGQHSDTFAIGPAWTETRTALLGRPSDTAVATSGTSTPRETPIYIVTTYRALPGHRDQLEQTLRKIAALNPGRYITLQHMEGSPWDVLTVARYASWTDFANDEMQPNMERLKAQGYTTADAPSFDLREHMVEHHDTLAMRVEGPIK